MYLKANIVSDFISDKPYFHEVMNSFGGRTMSAMVVAMAGLAMLNKLSASSTLFNGKLNWKKWISSKGRNFYKH